MLVLCIVGVILGNQQNQTRVKGTTDGLSSLVITIVSPIAAPFRVGSDRLRDISDGIVRGHDLAIENERLRAQNQAADLYLLNVQRLEREIEALRTLQNYPQVPGKDRVNVDIIGYFPHENRITIAAGANQKLRPGMPVVSAFGMLGIIQTVDKDRSQALLMSSASIQIGGIVSNRNPSPAGMLRGGSSVLSLTLEDPKSSVEIGDTVSTSGFSERIPRGILIGRVVQVIDNPAYGVRTADVLPATSIGEVREVFVLR